MVTAVSKYDYKWNKVMNMILIVGGEVDQSVLPSPDIIEYKILGHEPSDIKKVNIIGKSPKVSNIYLHYDLGDNTFLPEVVDKMVYFTEVTQLVEFLTNGVDLSKTNLPTIQLDIVVPEKEPQQEEVSEQPESIEEETTPFVLEKVNDSLNNKKEETNIADLDFHFDMSKFQDNIDKLQEGITESVNAVSDSVKNIEERKEQEREEEQNGLVIIDNSNEVLQSKLRQREEEIAELQHQLEGGIEKVVSAYKKKIDTLEVTYKTLLEEANEKISTLSSKVNELSEMKSRNIIDLYGSTPQAKTIKRKRYKLPQNVYFFTRGVGVSIQSFFTEVMGLLNNGKSTIILDLTCTQASAHFLKVSTEANAVTLDKLSNYNSAKKYGEGYIYPSVYANELTLLEYDFSKVLNEISNVANGLPIVVLLPSFETVTTRTIIDDLISGGARGTLMCDGNTLNIVMTCEMIGFLNKKELLNMYVTKVTDAITPLLQRANTVVPVKAFRENIAWSNGIFFD